MKPHQLQILTASYWEHFKAAKDLAMILPVDSQKRIAVENSLNELQELTKVK